MVCSTLFWIFGLTREIAFGSYTNKTIDPQAQREGGFDHWLAFPGDGYGQAQGSSRGDQIEDVKSLGDNALDNEKRAISICLMKTSL